MNKIEQAYFDMESKDTNFQVFIAGYNIKDKEIEYLRNDISELRTKYIELDRKVRAISHKLKGIYE